MSNNLETREEIEKKLADLNIDFSEEDTIDELKSKLQDGKKTKNDQPTQDNKKGKKSISNDPQFVKTGKDLSAQKKETVYIPLSQGEKPGTSEMVWINGYVFNIPKGKQVDVPSDVAKIVRESLTPVFSDLQLNN